MTKNQYLDMCEMLGSEPIENEMPVEFEDFPLEVQQAFSVYRMLKDEWEGFNGLYLGKSFIGLTEVLQYMEIDHSDRKLIVQLIKVIDTIRGDQLAKIREQKPASN
jgi:hypothetical protein